MRVRWTTTAAADLTHIVEYIRQDNPAAARRVARTGRVILAERLPRGLLQSAKGIHRADRPIPPAILQVFGKDLRQSVVFRIGPNVRIEPV